MSAVVIYFSKFGNTKSVAEAVAAGLAVDGSARAVSIDELVAEDLAGADIVVAGSPTHKMNLPDDVRAALDKLPRHALKGAKIAAFDTSYHMSPFLARFTASKKLDKSLRKLGGKRAAPPETFFVAGKEGPLDDGELERASAWAQTIAGQVN